MKQLILYGSKGKKFKNAWQNENGRGEFMMRFEGIIPQLERRMHETTSEEMRRYYLLYISDKPCPACNGNKLKPASLAVKIAGKNISEITAMSIREV